MLVVSLMHMASALRIQSPRAGWQDWLEILRHSCDKPLAMSLSIDSLDDLLHWLLSFQSFSQGMIIPRGGGGGGGGGVCGQDVITNSIDPQATSACEIRLMQNNPYHDHRIWYACLGSRAPLFVGHHGGGPGSLPP